MAGTTRTKEMMFIRQPIGVVGMITPWNFPNAMITRKVKKSTSPRPQIFLNLFKLRTFFWFKVINRWDSLPEDIKMPIY